MRHLSIITSCALTLIALPALADKLNVKTGLWEVLMTMELEGKIIPASPAIPTPEALAKFPPEGRAKIEKMIADLGPIEQVPVRLCVVTEDLQRGVFGGESSATEYCKIESSESTSSTQEIVETCTNPRINYTARINTVTADTEKFDGTLETSVVNGKPAIIKQQFHAKWLRADCGTLRAKQRR